MKLTTMQKIFISSCFILAAFISCAQKNNNTKQIVMTNNDSTIPAKVDTADFGEGCFWCTEAFFQRLKGVISVKSGYGGGHVTNPTYEQVCDKRTGHAEMARITFDPTVITYDELLEVFWKTHDPTTLDQQGADKGPQYRSVIFYHNAEQKEKAEKYKIALNQSGAWDKPIVTAIEPFKNFYPAEDYHDNYYNNNNDQGYCRYVIAPKLEKFEKVFKNKLKDH
jgi:peptide-methionine (S)-S-oxide reductase